MRIEQYFLMTGYSLWEVILNEQRLAKKNELNRRGTLLMALPETIKKRLKKLISQLEIIGESLSEEDINLKFLRSLPSKWRTHTLIWRNKANLEDQSLDDLLNNLEIYEAEVKSSSSTSHNTQNIAFVSSNNTDSTNESVSVVVSVSTASIKAPISTLPNVDNLSDVVIYSFFANDHAYHKSQEVSLKDWKESRSPRDTRNKDTQRRTIPVETSTSNALLSSSESDDSVPTSLVNDRYKSGEGYHVVPPPYTRTFMPPKPDLVFHDAPTASETVPNVFIVEPSTTKPTKDMTSVKPVEQPKQAENLSTDTHKSIEINGGYVAFGGNPKGGKITSKGIKREFSVAITPQHNRVAERKNRTLIEAARTMLADSLLPIPFWAEAVNTVCKAFRVFNSKTRIVQETLNINFLENQPNVAGSGPKWLFDIDTLTRSMNYQPVVARNQPSHNAENENEVHVSLSSSNQPKKHDEKAKREAKGKSHVDLSTGVRDSRDEFEEFYVNSTNRNAVSPHFAIGGKSSFMDHSQYPDDPGMPALEDIVSSDDEEDTRSMARMVKEQGGLNQINDEDFHTFMFACFLSQEEPKRVHQALQDPSWIESMQEELLQFKMQKVWVLVDLPKAYASFMGFMVYQMDVKSAFLYETIEEEVYVCQSLGFKDHDYPDKIYKVVKALYGLHQAPRAWYETLANYLLENGFQRGKIDQTLFIKKQKGLQVKQKDDGIFISQDKYKAKILRKFGLADGKSASTPIDTEKPLLKDPDGEDVNVHIYSDYAGASLDRKSTTGGCQFLGCRLISWQCKKQTVVATSSIEAKYVAVASCCAQVLWIQNQLLDYGPKLVLLVLIEAQHHISNESPLLGVNTPRCDEDRCCSLNAARSQFWASVSVKKTNDVVKLQALIDRKKVVVTKDTIRQDLRLDDADGVECLTNEEIFTELARMGYEKLPPKLTFYKHDDLFSHTTKYTSLTLTQKVFANMRRIGKGFSGVETPLFATLLVQPQAAAEEEGDDDEEDASKQGEIAEIDADEDVTLVDVDTVVEMDADIQGRLEEKDKVNVAAKEVNAAEPIVFNDKEVTMTIAQTLIKMKAEKAKLLDEQMDKRLHDEEVEQAAAKERQEQDDFKRAQELQQQYDQNQENINWNVVAEQIQEKHLDNIKKYQNLMRKPISVAQARKNMIVYLMNMVGYKIAHFKDTPTVDPKEISKEDVQNMLQIILVAEFKVEALQVKYPLIDWEIYSEGSRTYWKIIRVGGITQAFQSFEDVLKDFDRKDLDTLWRLVKERFSIAVPIVDKEKAL
nr:hypothetical protein [Tanacetum cinerariifolium]